MAVERQKQQELLALAEAERGEASSPEAQGVETDIAKPANESQAVTEKLMEEIWSAPQK